MKKKQTKSKGSLRDKLIDKAILDFKTEEPEAWEEAKGEQHSLYGCLESYIDGLLYDEAFNALAPNYGNGEEEDEILLEKLVFAAIKKVLGKRHKCDPYYDEAFGGRDGL